MKKIICLIFLVPSIFYSQDWVTPVIKGYGKIKYSKNIAVQPDINLQYKAVYKITKTEKREGINKGLNGIAHAINMLGCRNIKKENVDIVATIQGQATTIVLSDEAYAKKFGTKNPKKSNRASISIWSKIIRMFSGNSNKKIKPSDINQNITEALSGSSVL